MRRISWISSKSRAADRLVGTFPIIFNSLAPARAVVETQLLEIDGRNGADPTAINLCR